MSADEFVLRSALHIPLKKFIRNRKMSIYKTEKKCRKGRVRDAQPRETHEKQSIVYGVQSKPNNIHNMFRIVN